MEQLLQDIIDTETAKQQAYHDVFEAVNWYIDRCLKLAELERDLKKLNK